MIEWHSNSALGPNWLLQKSSNSRNRISGIWACHAGGRGSVAPAISFAPKSRYLASRPVRAIGAARLTLRRSVPSIGMAQAMVAWQRLSRGSREDL
jgi:hypothetical protein